MSLVQLKRMIGDRLNVHQIRIDDIAEKDINFVRLNSEQIPELIIEQEIFNDYDLILSNFRIRNLLTIKLRMSDDVFNDSKTLDLEILELMTLIETELSKKK